MGMIICPKHGSRVIIFACPHIVAAVQTGTACDGIDRRTYTTNDPELEGVEDSGWFCPKCIKEYKLPADRTVLSDPDAFLPSVSRIYRPVCPDCFNKWHRAHST
jgi:hypothetical protein